MNYIKTFESYSDNEQIEQYTNDIFTFLKKYNLFPEDERNLRVAYADQIKNSYDEGKYTQNYAKEFAEKIANDLQLSTDGLMQYKMTGGNQWQNIYYR